MFRRCFILPVFYNYDKTILTKHKHYAIMNSMKKQNKKITTETEVVTDEIVLQSQLNQDFKNSVLIVSLIVNAFVLIGWITLQVTNLYDAQVTAFLFTR